MLEQMEKLAAQNTPDPDPIPTQQQRQTDPEKIRELMGAVQWQFCKLYFARWCRYRRRRQRNFWRNCAKKVQCPWLGTPGNQRHCNRNYHNLRRVLGACNAVDWTRTPYESVWRDAPGLSNHQHRRWRHIELANEWRHECNGRMACGTSRIRFDRGRHHFQPSSIRFVHLGNAGKVHHWNVQDERVNLLMEQITDIFPSVPVVPWMLPLPRVPVLAALLASWLQPALVKLLRVLLLSQKPIDWFGTQCRSCISQWRGQCWLYDERCRFGLHSQTRLWRY